MAESIQLRYGYYEGVEEVDVPFFRQLPERKPDAPVRFTEKGIEPAGPDPITIGSVIISGTATATVAALASIIKSWLASRHTRIELKSEKTDKSIIYDGPLSGKIIDIASELSQFIDAEGNSASIHASRRESKKVK